MPRNVARKVRAKELSPSLRRRFHLVPDEEVNIAVTRESAHKAPHIEDPWIGIRGTLSPEEADEMIAAIHESRRSKTNPPEFNGR